MRCRCSKTIRLRYEEQWETESECELIFRGRLPLVVQRGWYGSFDRDNKAFNMVEHSFIYQTLEHFGFGPKCIILLECYIKT